MFICARIRYQLRPPLVDKDWAYLAGEVCNEDSLLSIYLVWEYFFLPVIIMSLSPVHFSLI